MALTEEQRTAVAEVVAALNAELNGMIAARDTVLAVLRIDEHDPDYVEAWPAIQNAKARAKTHAEALAGLLE